MWIKKELILNLYLGAQRYCTSQNQAYYPYSHIIVATLFKGLFYVEYNQSYSLFVMCHEHQKFLVGIVVPY